MRQGTIDYLRSVKFPVYVWGSGEIAELTRDALNSVNIDVAGCVVDAMYMRSKEDITKEMLITSGKEYILIKGFLNAFFMTDDEVKKLWPGCQDVITISDIYEPAIVEPMTEEFYLSHKDLFDNVSRALADELSVKSLEAYIGAKISKMNNGLIPVVERKQYFFDGAPWTYKQSDILYEGGGVQRR